MKIAVALILFVLFFAVCYLGTGTTRKNMKSFYSYPDVIQKKIRANAELSAMIPQKTSYAVSFLSNLILFTFMFSVVGFLVGVNTFSESLIYFMLLGQGLNLFDFLVIDLFWWRRTKRIRFSEIDAEAKLYADSKKHFFAFLRGVPMFGCAAVLSTLLTTVLR